MLNVDMLSVVCAYTEFIIMSIAALCVIVLSVVIVCVVILWPVL